MSVPAQVRACHPVSHPPKASNRQLEPCYLQGYLVTLEHFTPLGVGSRVGAHATDSEVLAGRFSLVILFISTRHLCCGSNSREFPSTASLGIGDISSCHPTLLLMSILVRLPRV